MRTRKLLGMVALAAFAASVPLWFSGSLRESVRAFSRETTAPFGRFRLAVGERLGAWTSLLDVVAVQAENQRLGRRVRELEEASLVARSVEMENRDLRRQLGLVRSRLGWATAEVLSLGGSDGWSQRIRISKGRLHGVRVHCPVLSAQGLVGRVVEVTATTADVLLISDPNSQVACAFDPEVPSARGILMGGGLRCVDDARLELLHTVEPLRLAYLEKDAEIPASARVVTSGLGGVYPRGIPVGLVIETRPDPSGLFQRSSVVPFVDFRQLRQVTVLLGGGAP